MDNYDNYNGYYNAGGLPTKWQPSPGFGDPMKASPPGTLPPPPGAWGQMPPYPPMPTQGNMSSELSSSGPQGPPLPPPSPSVLNFASKSSFSFDELSAATNGFSQGNLIGQGGFGYVSKLTYEWIVYVQLCRTKMETKILQHISHTNRANYNKNFKF
jgi:hypothetical protein